MRRGNLGDDGKSQARPCSSGATPPPEPLETTPSVLFGNSRPVVRDADGAFRQHCYSDFGLRRRIDNGILDQVAQSVFNRIGLTRHPDRLFRTVEVNHALAPDRPRRQPGTAVAARAFSSTAVCDGDRLSRRATRSNCSTSRFIRAASPRRSCTEDWTTVFSRIWVYREQSLGKLDGVTSQTGATIWRLSHSIDERPHLSVRGAARLFISAHQAAAKLAKGLVDVPVGILTPR